MRITLPSLVTEVTWRAEFLRSTAHTLLLLREGSKQGRLAPHCSCSAQEALLGEAGTEFPGAPALGLPGGRFFLAWPRSRRRGASGSHLLVVYSEPQEWKLSTAEVMVVALYIAPVSSGDLRA
jgi:hypothetical protein